MKEDVNNLKERLLTFIEYKGISKNAFEQNCGLSTRYVSNIGKSIGSEAIAKIVETYPELNTNWLLYGEGKMLLFSQSPSGNIEKIPVIPAEAHGGALDGYAVEGATLAQCEYITAPIPATLAIRVTGDSMSPEYPSGSLVLVRKINEAVLIEYGCCYVLDTTEGVIIKEVHKSKRDDYITCVSINPDPKFASFELGRKYIKGWYRVLMVMSMK